MTDDNPEEQDSIVRELEWGEIDVPDTEAAKERVRNHGYIARRLKIPVEKVTFDSHNGVVAREKVRTEKGIAIRVSDGSVCWDELTSIRHNFSSVGDSLRDRFSISFKSRIKGGVPVDQYTGFSVESAGSRTGFFVLELDEDLNESARWWAVRPDEDNEDSDPFTAEDIMQELLRHTDSGVMKTRYLLDSN